MKTPIQNKKGYGLTLREVIALAICIYLMSYAFFGISENTKSRETSGNYTPTTQGAAHTNHNTK